MEVKIESSMADYERLIPFVIQWESSVTKKNGETLESLYGRARQKGLVNDPQDLGGLTLVGVTLSTFRSAYGSSKTPSDLKGMTFAQWEHVFKVMFWDKWKADQIENQNVANMLVDWLWCSGAYAIKIPQSVLRVDVDGVVGPKTIAAVNKCDPETLFKRLKTERLEFLKRICKSRPQNKKFLKGWQNRVNALG